MTSKASESDKKTNPATETTATATAPSKRKKSPKRIKLDTEAGNEEKYTFKRVSFLAKTKVGRNAQNHSRVLRPRITVHPDTTPVASSYAHTAAERIRRD